MSRKVSYRKCLKGKAFKISIFFSEIVLPHSFALWKYKKYSNSSENTVVLSFLKKEGDFANVACKRPGTPKNFRAGTQ